MKILMILVAGVFVNNFILSKFLGICSFLGVSKKLETSVGMMPFAEEMIARAVQDTETIRL